MKESIILIGGGGHCKSCIDVIEQEGKYSIEGIVDLPEKIGQNILGYPIIATDDEIKDLAKKYQNFFITLGQIKSPDRRVKLFAILKELKVKLPAIVSPIAYLSKHAEIGEGTIIMHHALVNTNAKVESNCIINTKALIEHDAKIGDHCHVSTGAIVNGHTILGEKSFLGSNSVTRESIQIPANSFVKANSLVI